MTSPIRSSREPAVHAEGLVKSFGTNRAVDGVDLTVEAGTVYGVLGPNGAGKTTTISMLATLLRPDAGTARIFGHDVMREAHLSKHAGVVRASSDRCGPGVTRQGGGLMGVKLNDTVLRHARTLLRDRRDD